MKRVNHAMNQMSIMIVNERQNDWDFQHLHVKFAHNNSGKCT